MATPIPYDLRLKIIRDRESGKTYKQIAQQCECSEIGAKKIWKRYQAEGLEGLRPRYANSGRHSLYNDEVRNLIASVKTGDQGAPYIRSVLMEKFPDKTFPHERTIQRWWKAKGENRPKRPSRQNKSSWSKEVHHTWQIDGKEEVSLSTGRKVSWINVGDEASGSELLAEVFPLRKGESDTATKSGAGHQ